MRAENILAVLNLEDNRRLLFTRDGVEVWRPNDDHFWREVLAWPDAWDALWRWAPESEGPATLPVPPVESALVRLDLPAPTEAHWHAAGLIVHADCLELLGYFEGEVYRRVAKPGDALDRLLEMAEARARKAAESGDPFAEKAAEPGDPLLAQARRVLGDGAVPS
jgi:hypothetical protein